MEDLHDSNDELYISWYFQELKDKDIIVDFTRSSSYELNKPLQIEYIKTTELKTKTKTELKVQTLIPIKIYTPDFEVIWNSKGENKLFSIFYGMSNEKHDKPFIVQPTNVGKLGSVIEVKPIFDQNNMTRLFKTNQAIMWDKYEIYINLITYQELFEATFTPLKYIIEEGTYKKSCKGGAKGTNKIKWKVRTLDEFLNL